MKFEILKRSHLKRNIIIGILVIGIISAMALTFTKAKYRTTKSIPLITGTINYSLTDLNIIAITVDGKKVDKITDENYELTSESYCTVNGEKDNNVKLSYDNATQSLSITPMTSKGTKCYLYFTKKGELVEETFTLTSTQNPTDSTVILTQSIEGLISVENVEIISGGGEVNITTSENKIIINATNGNNLTGTIPKTCTAPALTGYSCPGGTLINNQCQTINIVNATYSYQCIMGFVVQGSYDPDYPSQGYTCNTPTVTCKSATENPGYYDSTTTTCTKTTYSTPYTYSYCNQGTLSGATCTYDCNTTYNYYEYVIKITYYKEK